LIPDRILTTLGWPAAGGPAEVRRSTCRRESGAGAVNVQRRPVAAVGGDDLPEKSRQAYEARCAELEGLPDPDRPEVPARPGEPVDWLGPDQPACAVVEEDRGWNVLLTLTPEHRLIEVWIEVDEATPPAKVRAALTELAEIATARF
jgi:hypothetical protein